MSTAEATPLKLGNQELSRYTMVAQIHHQPYREEPFSIPITFSETLDTKLEPYSRKIDVLGEPRTIDTGWLDESDIRYLIVENYEGRRHDVNLSPEELKVESGRIVEIWMPGATKPILVPPRSASMPLCIEGTDGIMLSCRQDTARCRVTLLPR